LGDIKQGGGSTTSETDGFQSNFPTKQIGIPGLGFFEKKKKHLVGVGMIGMEN
jgi:hypothetical protein